MFGESESESPRVGSPWDSLLSSGASTPPSPPGAFDSDLPKIYKLSLPKLVPEAEEVRISSAPPSSSSVLHTNHPGQCRIQIAAHRTIPGTVPSPGDTA